MVVPQHCDLLEYVIKATHEELDVLEIWWGDDVLFGDGRCGAMYIMASTFYFLVNIFLKSGWMLPTSRRSLLANEGTYVDPDNLGVMVVLQRGVSL
jgi:hypothetical protein